MYDGSQSGGAGDVDRERINIGIAEYEVTTDGVDLTMSGLGSCVGVTLYDDRADVAGIVHVMLPAVDEMAEGNAAKFADAGTEMLIEELEAAGATRANLEAKLAGGSDMLDFSNSGPGIGDRNAEKVRETLRAYDIPIVGEDVGGDHVRSLRLESRTGTLVIKSANGDELCL